MAKLPKFMICENPMIKEHRIFICHTQTPFILAEAFHYDIDQEQEWLECKSIFSVGASVDYPGELICLGAVMFDSVDADTLAKIMSRMGDWYHSYLKWEDNNIVNEEDN
ncbi:MAG: hypothetical protein HS119_11440 [Flavobacteriales bacterium]|nr:hypothetical protein [Flavobacteriales bacterium]